MRLTPFQYLLLLLVSIPTLLTQELPVDTGDIPKLISVNLPKVVLYNYKLNFDLTLSWQNASVNSNSQIKYELYEGWTDEEAFKIGEGTLKADEGLDINIESSIKQGELATGYLIQDLDLTNQVTRRVWLKLLDSTSKVFATFDGEVHGMPAPVTLLPILVVLLVALLSSQATLALLLGVFISATFINGFNPLTGFLRTLDYYTIRALANQDHAKVIMFTFYLSSCVSLIQKSGGAEALTNAVTKLATNRWKGQWATFLIGIILFLDDLASCMVVGANMLNVTDKLSLSREKLAFIVHVTSAPLTSLSPISSWIGFMLGLIATQFSILKIDSEPFLFFCKTIPSRSFPILAIVFTGMLIATKRDFGLMLAAERRAYFEGSVIEVDGNNSIEETSQDPLKSDPKLPKRLVNSLLPIASIVLLTITGLLVTGYYSLQSQIAKGESPVVDLSTIAGAGDSYGALLYASFFSCLLCLVIYHFQNVIRFKTGMEVMMYGIKDMVETMLILVFAWAVADCFNDLNVSTFMISALKGNLSPSLIPFLACLLSAIISFSTGTSWGTMTIMLPLVMPLVVDPNDESKLIYTVSAVFSGALFGDLNSPIAATSILTCMACKLPVRTHIKSQSLYAVIILLTSLVFGYLPLGFELYPDWAGLLIGIAVLLVVIMVFGTRTETLDVTPLDRFKFKVFRKGSGSNNSDNDKVIDTKDDIIGTSL